MSMLMAAGQLLGGADLLTVLTSLGPVLWRFLPVLAGLGMVVAGLWLASTDGSGR